MAVVEVDEVQAEGIGAVGSVDIAAAEVPQEEDVAAETEAIDIADLGFHEIEVLVGSTVLAEEQKEFGSEEID